MNILTAERQNSRHPVVRRGITYPRIVATLVGALAGGCVPAVSAQPSALGPQAIEAGRQLFVRCAACHARSPAARPGTGPHLAGIVGRPAASLPGFNYTAMLKGQSFVWSREKLDQWLRKPQKHFPGMCVPFAGFARKEDRQALIAWLESPVQ